MGFILGGRYRKEEIAKVGRGWENIGRERKKKYRK